MSDNPLNARQLEQIRNEAAAAVQAAVDKMQLRKWAVEQAIAAYLSSNKLVADAQFTDDTPLVFYSEPMKLAQAIYDFVSQPANIKIEIE